jgi:hypothetical protein
MLPSKDGYNASKHSQAALFDLLAHKRGRDSWLVFIVLKMKMAKAFPPTIHIG